MHKLLKLWIFLLTLSIWPVATVIFLVAVAWSAPGSEGWQLWLLPSGMGIAMWGGARALGEGGVRWPAFLVAHLPREAWLVWARFGG
ncbi:hypothetical protein [Rhodoferax sp.]|uniref:hypothetical protein n=1 Tax=Rhodoferax sp. TaxID=50421 RepID=UPI0025E22ADE|nr:hypothetical protein [Rhodoferax sp.]